jgi:cutinase
MRSEYLFLFITPRLILQLTTMFSYTLLLALAVSTLAAPMAPQSCADVTVYFARGTREQPAPLGNIVGPPFQSALRSALGSKTLEFVGIEYLAIIPGFLVGGGPIGVINMANSVISKANSCPNTKIVISGYR